MNNPKVFRCVICDEIILKAEGLSMEFRGSLVCPNPKCKSNSQKLLHTILANSDGAKSIIELDKEYYNKLIK